MLPGLVIQHRCQRGEKLRVIASQTQRLTICQQRIVIRIAIEIILAQPRPLLAILRIGADFFLQPGKLRLWRLRVRKVT